MAVDYSSMRELAWDLYRRVGARELPALSAQISYFALLGIFPFLMFLLTLLDYTPFTRAQTLEQLSTLLPDAAYQVIRTTAAEISAVNNLTVLSLTFLAAFWAASRGTFVLIRCVNRAYEDGARRSVLRENVFGLLATLGLAGVILLSLSFLVFGRVWGWTLLADLGLAHYFVPLWSLLRQLLPVVFIALVFSLFYLYAPHLPLSWRQVWPGALFTTLAWLKASHLFAFYVNNFAVYSLVYGSLAGFIVFLIWLYLSSMIVLLGAELNASLYKTGLGAGAGGKGSGDAGSAPQAGSRGEGSGQEDEQQQEEDAGPTSMRGRAVNLVKDLWRGY